MKVERETNSVVHALWWQNVRFTIRMACGLHVIGNLVGGRRENQEQCVQSLMLSRPETSRDLEANYKTFLICLGFVVFYTHRGSLSFRVLCQLECLVAYKEGRVMVNWKR